MKIYVHNDSSLRALLVELLEGRLHKVTVHVSDRPYACIEVWGSYIEMVEYIKAHGCAEYKFPEKGK